MITPSTARISLDGTWQFLHIGDDRAAGPALVRLIRVPGVWQAQFEDLRTRAGIGIYTRKVQLTAEFLSDGPLRLCFGAAFHATRVWINGKDVGAHEGGFLPFSFDISHAVRPGENEITVRVDGPTDDPDAFPDSPLGEIPFGKQSWYGPWTGLWQSVFIERRVPDHVCRLRLQPERATGRVRIETSFAAPTEPGTTLCVEVFDPSGRPVVDATRDISPGSRSSELTLKVAEVHDWSPDAPNLYRVKVELWRGGAPVDVVEDRFGFRTFEARGGRFYLNGELFYLRGALDQDYYPDTIATPPSTDFLRDQFRKAKQLGLNLLRLHIKLPDPRYYQVADEMGLLVWAELPNGGIATERSRARKEALLKGMVDRDGNHPSIVIWTIINENWGVDLVHDADDRAWLKKTWRWLKDYDPGRLVVDNSPLAPSFHVISDIADYHNYAAIPDMRLEWDAFVDDLASRPVWMFSPEGDAVVTGQEPLMCSEFGNWGLPDPRDLVDSEGREPWWFETGHDWGEGVMYAHGLEHRFFDWSLDRVFGSLSRFVAAAQWQQFRALKYQIESMRRHPSIAGYVITEFTDAHWEANGLLDMRRNPRVFHDAMRMINADVVIVPRWRRLSYWSGELAQLSIAIANGAPARIDNATLEISMGADVRVLPIASVEPGAVLNLTGFDVHAPEVAEPALKRWRLRLAGSDGREIAANWLDLAVHPRPAIPGHNAATAPAWSPDPAIRARLAQHGYPLADRLQDATLVVAQKADHDIIMAVRHGARLLLVIDEPASLNPFFPHWQKVRTVERAETPWRGDWASSFAWLRRQGPFAGIPGGPLLDETFDRVIPEHVIRGCNLIDFQSRVHAGLVVGWIHKPVALTVERSYGRGRIVATTFRLFRDPPGTDPTAARLLDAHLAAALRAAAAPVTPVLPMMQVPVAG